MSNEQKGRTFDSLYLPLIIVIPANILLFFRLNASSSLAWGIVPYVVFTLFLLIAGSMAFRRREKKAMTLGSIYIAAGLVFTVLIFLIF